MGRWHAIALCVPAKDLFCGSRRANSSTCSHRKRTSARIPSTSTLSSTAFARPVAFTRTEMASIQRVIRWPLSIFAASKESTWKAFRFSTSTDGRCESGTQGGKTMFKDTKAFSGFPVNDIQKAKEFYGQTLGLEVSE